MKAKCARWSVWSFLFLLVAVVAQGQAQETTAERPAWDVTLKSDFKASSTLTVQNRCLKTHSFRVSKENLPFIRFLEDTERVEVGGGQTRVLPLQFDTTGMQAGFYQGQVLVLCLTCGSEPTCSQDRERLPVNLTIAETPETSEPAAPATSPNTLTESSTEERQPCEQTSSECEELRRIAWEKEAEAAGAQAAADEARAGAEEAEVAAREAEEAAQQAAEAAQEPDEGDWYIEDGETGRRYTKHDFDLKRQAAKQGWNDYKAGKISAEELAQRWEELGGLDAYDRLREEERRKLEERKREAEEAARKAAEARAAADAASAAADAAQAAADAAREGAGAARRAYEDCVAKLKAECDQIRREQERAEAERRAQEEAARRAREEAERHARDEAERQAERERQQELERQRTLERQRELERQRQAQQEAAERAARARREHTEYLLRNIRDLNLIVYPGFWETPGLWDWLPDAIEKPVGDFVEDRAGGVIPTDVFKAIGGLYNIVGAMLDPCTALGSRKTVERLENRVNPRTGRNYTLNEALTKTNQMCRLLRKMKSLSERAHRGGD